MIEDFFTSGRAVAFILVFVAVEAIGLSFWLRRRGRSHLIAWLLANLASGSALLLAVWFALQDAHWTAIAACLLASFVAHILDIVLRFK